MRAKAADRGFWRRRTPFEWVLLGLSLIATTAVLIGLVVSELTGPMGPAELRASIVEAGPAADGGRVLEISVENLGGESAVNVLVEVTVGDLTREVSLDLVASGETEFATIVVPAAASGEPTAEVAAYADP
jgi:uncharacterized protein (TIGR02588 family)